MTQDERQTITIRQLREWAKDRCEHCQEAIEDAIRCPMANKHLPPHPRTRRSQLVGRVITAVDISGDRQTLTFSTLQGPVIFETWADCCSDTWIESIDDEQALIGGRVQSVEDLDMPNLGDIPTLHRDNVDSVCYYGMKVTTDKGRAVIDFRNNSNGYYGGQLEEREGGAQPHHDQ